MFVELFAGTARLSQAVNRFLDTRPDDALTMGGTNFLDPIAIEALKKRCAEFVKDGRLLFFHVAPPCSTFSRARDRGARTRLRTPASPQGIQPNERRTEEGNRIARATADLVTYLVTELDARGSWEQPCGSYMFPFLDGEGALDQIERSAVILHQCRFGAPYRKPTTFWLFGGLQLPSLDRRCTVDDSCGREFHVQLGFGHHSTQAAAEYPRQLCAAYAADLHKDVQRRTLAETAVARAVAVDKGRVRRHIDRGETTKSARELRDEEDAQSRAGWLCAGLGCRVPQLRQTTSLTDSSLPAGVGGSKLSISGGSPLSWKDSHPTSHTTSRRCPEHSHRYRSMA